MSSFSGISEETQEILDRIDSNIPPSRIEQLWDCISWWCASGNPGMLSHFLEMLFQKLFQEYRRKICDNSNDRPIPARKSPKVLQPLSRSLSDRRDTAVERLDVKLVQLQQRLQKQRQQLHPQPQQQWLQPQGHQSLPQNLHQQKEEPPQPTEELFILACQVLTALPEDDTLMGDLVDVFMYACLTDVPIEKAASYLSTERLNRVSRDLEAERSLGDFTAAAETLRKISRERSLEKLSVLSTLGTVQGDAKKVWSLSEPPETVKGLFHVPFLTLFNNQ